ncbi:MAG: flagellar biosynthetic protein FliO, partial [Planctomycetaceae bacterium]|nr:flagellar biosynthetic protein FliO [Planctomycetaceae bacterium]
FGNDVATNPQPIKPDALLDKPFNLTRKEKPAKSIRETASVKWSPLISTLGALVLVLGLFFLFAFIMKRASPKSNAQLPKELAEHLGRVSLTQKVQLHLLRIGDRLILLSVTADGATPISEITDRDEVVRLLGYCRKYDKNSSTASFHQMLNGHIPSEETAKDNQATESLTGLLANGITNQTRGRAKAG